MNNIPSFLGSTISFDYLRQSKEMVSLTFMPIKVFEMP